MTMTTYDNIFKNCLKIYSHNKCHYYKTNENHTILAVVFLGGLMEPKKPNQLHYNEDRTIKTWGDWSYLP